MKIYSAILLAVCITTIQTTQCFESYNITNIDNRSGMLYELRDIRNDAVCTKDIPSKSYSQESSIMEIGYGTNTLQDPLISTNRDSLTKVFKLVPKTPLTFEDGRMMKVGADFVPNATIFFIIQEDTLYYRMKQANERTIINKANIHYEKFIDTQDTENTKAITINGSRLVINPDYSLSIE